MTYSWSRIQTFLTCQRKHELAYLENLERIPNIHNEGRYYGTAFHEAMAENLRCYDLPIEQRTKHAINMAQQAIHVMTEQYVDDQEYYQMINEIHNTVPDIITYAISKIDLERYTPISPRELMGHAQDNLMVEYAFDYFGLVGRIDAVLHDNVTGENVIVDWKLHKSFISDDAAAMDGQLAFYAAVLEEMGAIIHKTILWQVKRNPPLPARLNQSGLPSVAAQNTTFEFWWNSLPSDLKRKLKRDEWREMLEHKVKTDRDFINPVDSLVTKESSELALANVNYAITAIERAEKQHELGIPAPAILSGFTCQYCDFFRLCKVALKYGAGTEDIIKNDYRPRKNELDTESIV